MSSSLKVMLANMKDTIKHIKEECDHMEFLKKQSQNKKARLDRLT